MGNGARPGKLIRLGLLTWWSVLGWPDTGWDLEGEYPARSPSLGRRIIFDDAEIGAEIERLLEKRIRDGVNATPVEYLAETVKLFAHPDRVVSPEAREWARQFRLCRALGLPPGPTLEEVPVRTADAFVWIEQEMAAAQAYRARQAKGRP